MKRTSLVHRLMTSRHVQVHVLVGVHVHTSHNYHNLIIKCCTVYLLQGSRHVY